MTRTPLIAVVSFVLPVPEVALARVEYRGALEAALQTYLSTVLEEWDVSSMSVRLEPLGSCEDGPPPVASTPGTRD